MTTPTLDQHIHIDPGVAGGKPRIAGHRITVMDIAIWHERLGLSADEISTEYELRLADVHAGLAYYHDHRAEIDAQMQESEAFAQAMRQRVASKIPGKVRG